MSNWNALPMAALLLLGGLGGPGPARANDAEGLGFERTPPRLAFVDGEVSFLRLGAEDWSAAEVNTPLAAGDELFAAEGANLEVQIGARAYLRAGEVTQVALTTLEPDYLQLRVSEGFVSLDLRTLTKSQTFEIDTPRGAFTIERSGYYRIQVADDATTFIARRGGLASVTTAEGETTTIAASEQLVITGADLPRLETYAAPELDAWDRWNYARTDRQLDAVSARYVPSGVYGVEELDHHGDWRVVPSYGAIWVPRGVASGWAPYTTGRWIHDPFYGWTWVDAMPWGWAPYHYGRWVSVSGYWGWAPGPLVVRPYYAPALVAFFGGGVSVGISTGPPDIGWVALGWGEPLVPWWGPRGCRGVPRWGGWGGPRVVNRVVIERTRVVRVGDLRHYRNRDIRHAFVAVDRAQFGRRSVGQARRASADAGRFRLIEGDLGVRPARESLSPSGRIGRRPPKGWRERGVVATRAPRPAAGPAIDHDRAARPGARRATTEPARRASAPPVRVVEPRPRSKDRKAVVRPPFATRGDAERAAPTPPPRYRQTPGGSRANATSSTGTEAPKRNRAVGAEDPKRERAASAGPKRDRKAAAASPKRGREAAAAASPKRGREAAAAASPKRGRNVNSVARGDRETTTEVRTPALRDASKAPNDPVRKEQIREPARGERQRVLPGEPANRVYRGREAKQEEASQRSDTRQRAPQVSEGPPRAAQPDRRNQGGSSSRGAAGRRGHRVQ